MSGSRAWFIAAAACLILNIVLVLMPVDALNAIGALFLIAAVGLALRGAWVWRARRAASPHDVRRFPGVRRGEAPFMDLVAIGTASSPLTDRDAAPKQGDEGAPEATLVIEPEFVDGLDGIAAGDELLVFTWLDRAARDVLRVRPRSDPERRLQGVFSTRSPDRPNPIGLHRVTVLSIDGNRLRVRNLEALDGTPILDLKPLLRSVEER